MVGKWGVGEPTVQNHTGEPGPTWDHTGAGQAAGNLAKPEHQVGQWEARTLPEANREETMPVVQWSHYFCKILSMNTKWLVAYMLWNNNLDIFLLSQVVKVSQSLPRLGFDRSPRTFLANDRKTFICLLTPNLPCVSSHCASALTSKNNVTLASPAWGGSMHSIQFLQIPCQKLES